VSTLFPESFCKRVNHGDDGVYGGSATSHVAGEGAPFEVSLYHDDHVRHAFTVRGRRRATRIVRAWAEERRAPEVVA
jgi:hypothetical protein